MLSNKTGAILKENHYSVVYARDMTKELTSINHEIINSLLTNKNPDSLIINNSRKSFLKSLHSEENNITEIGEEKLASDIKSSYYEFNDSLMSYLNSQKNISTLHYLQNKYNNLYLQLMELSQMNENAIETKTTDAKVSAKNAAIRMSVVGTICFLVAYAFTFGFASYFNDRFYQFYEGLKILATYNYKEKLYFNGKDEFHEMSLIINEMVDKLYEAKEKKRLTSLADSQKDIDQMNLHELKEVLNQMKSIEKQAVELIFKLNKEK
jgi:methyl-accepting chemotaxis protein